jgi:hypothetical protein
MDKSGKIAIPARPNRDMDPGRRVGHMVTPGSVGFAKPALPVVTPSCVAGGAVGGTAPSIGVGYG